MDAMKGLFVGIEREGRFRGLETLFVPGSIVADPVDPEVTRIIEGTKHPHIYLGAGSDLFTNHGWLRDFVFRTEKVYTFEVSLDTYSALHPKALSRHNVRVVVTLRNVSALTGPQNVEIKMQDTHQCCLFTPGEVIDYTYAKDHPYVQL